MWADILSSRAQKRRLAAELPKEAKQVEPRKIVIEFRTRNAFFSLLRQWANGATTDNAGKREKSRAILYVQWPGSVRASQFCQLVSIHF